MEKIIKGILFFFFIFDVAVYGVPTKLSSRKIALLCIILWVLIKYIKNGYRMKCILHKKLIKRMYIFLIGITAVSVPYLIWRASCNDVLNTIGVEYPYAVYFIIFSLIAPLLFVYYFDSTSEMLFAVEFSAILQSAFIWSEYTIIPFKSWLQAHIITGNIKYTALDRATGLGASGSALTIILAYFVFILGYEGIVQYSKNLQYWLMIAFVMTAQFLSGRTGFYISILNIGLILFTILVEKKGLLKNILKCLGAFLIVVVVLGCWFLLFHVDGERLEYIFRRNLDKERVMATGEDSFYDNMMGGAVPEMKGAVLWGIGINWGETKDGILIENDSGYIKRYVAEGVLFATIEYISLLLLMAVLLHNIGGGGKLYLFWMIAVLFVVEIKEPFIYKYVEVTIILEELLMRQDDNNKGLLDTISL